MLGQSTSSREVFGKKQPVLNHSLIFFKFLFICAILRKTLIESSFYD